MSVEYIRTYYKVPAKRGRKVIMNKQDAAQRNEYEELILSIKTNFLSQKYNKYNTDRLIVLGESRAGKTVFLKEFINYLRENDEKFFYFSTSTEISAEKFILAHDKRINPWVSQDFVLPTVDFTEYQRKTIPILNDFIYLSEHSDNYNLFIEYPITKDSAGNRFVLNSLLQLAIINNSWLIIDELNFEDILQNIGNALNTRSNVAISLNNSSKLEHVSFDSWDQNLIKINNNLMVVKINPKSEY